MLSSLHIVVQPYDKEPKYAGKSRKEAGSTLLYMNQVCDCGAIRKLHMTQFWDLDLHRTRPKNWMTFRGTGEVGLILHPGADSII